MVTGRGAVAVVGGDAVSAMAAICLALRLPMPRAWIGLILSATLLWAALLSFGYRIP